MTVSTTQNLHAHQPSPENISILLVSPNPDDLRALRRILHHDDWHIERTGTFEEACQHLQKRGSSVVICERDLPDGDWKDLLHHTSELSRPPLLLVISRNADESLWAEVLNLGGYDVLLKPFDRSEVLRVISMAWRHWWGLWTRTKPVLGSARAHCA